MLVGNADDTFAQLVIKLHVKCFVFVGRNDVGIPHVAIHQRSFDVNFVFVIGVVDFVAGTNQN